MVEQSDLTAVACSAESSVLPATATAQEPGASVAAAGVDLGSAAAAPCCLLDVKEARVVDFDFLAAAAGSFLAFAAEKVSSPHSLAALHHFAIAAGAAAVAADRLKLVVPVASQVVAGLRFGC